MINDELQKLLDALEDEAALNEEAEERLFARRLLHAKQLKDEQIKNITLVKQAGLIATEEELKNKLAALEKEKKDKIAFEKMQAGKKVGKGKLTAKEKKEIEDRIKAEYAIREKAEKELAEKGKALKKRLDTRDAIQKRQEEAAEAARNKQEITQNIFGKGVKWSDRKDAWNTYSGAEKFAAITDALSNYAASLNKDIESISSLKGTIDTAMQGSKRGTFMGSYWDSIARTVKNATAISPLVKQSDINKNIQSMVSEGIVFNVEQRAFLNTIKDKIAATFDANDASLKRLIRIQQEDTTAGRLGMESALTAFLNNMYETTEYMKELATTTRGNLVEAQALMSAKSATELEYQVQKWAGSLYSVGMSRDAVSNITQALGQLAAGQIEGISNGGVGNLMVMAASNAGLNISDILQNGLTDSSANQLMAAMASYLNNIYNSTSGSRVVQQQYANVFGLKASDLKAAASLTPSLKSVSTNGLTYSGMMSRLTSMANSMYARTSIGELLGNVSDNFKTTLAAGIANNPALYAIYTAAGILKDLTGGIALPSVQFMGTGVNLNTTIADLMRVGALSGSLLDGIGGMISSFSAGGITGSGLLRGMGIGETTSRVTRGTGQGIVGANGITISNSGFVGNAEGGDVYNKTMTDQNDENKKTIAQAQEESNETSLSTVDEHVVNIYTLLQEVVNGSSNLHVSFGDTPSFSH